MRDLLVSILAVALLTGSWLIFFSYSESSIDYFSGTIEDTVIPMVEDGEWTNSYDEISRLNSGWNTYRKYALLFLDTEAINEIDCSMAKSIKYIKARDVSNASGELLVMCEQLKFLNYNEKITISNIL